MARSHTNPGATESAHHMKVLLIGGGGREHALAWKLSSSSLVTGLYALPGNPGISQIAECVPLLVNDYKRIERFIRNNQIEFVVIGPEEPLAAGMGDAIRAMGVKCFGPSKEAARIEADKWFAKELMRHQAIPTAEARLFTDPALAEEYARVHDGPLVIKAAGLAKGKGVSVCLSTQDALEAINSIMRHHAFGEAGARILIEERLQGPEVSILAFIDGQSIYLMEPSQDHKRVGDGDVGPMTGGMGAYSPTEAISEHELQQIESTVLVPVIDGLMREGIDYRGVLYAGLMLTPAGPKVLEFNCRFGDPETQPLMVRLKSDLMEVLLAVTDRRLDEVELEWDPRPSVCVVATSAGYPGTYKTGLPITGLEQADALQDVKVFHGGTKLVDGKIVTDGGRVLSVTAVGGDVAQARQRAYQAMSLIHFDGMQYRHDIGLQAIR